MLQGKSPSILSRVRTKVVGSKVAKLEKENKSLRSKLYQSEAGKNKEKQYPAVDPADREQVRKALQDAYREGSLFQVTAAIAAKKSRHDKYCRDALLYAFQMAAKQGKTVEHSLQELLLPALSASEIPERFLRGIEDEEVPSLAPAVSFRGLLTTRMRRKQLAHQLPEWELDTKEYGYQFAQSMEIPFPPQSQSVYSLKNLPLQPGTAVKPKQGAGGRGVYLLLGEEEYLNVKTSESLNTKEELVNAMEKDLQTGAVREDSWVTETLYYYNEQKREPARDLKFYCFYGEAALILEIQRYPETAYCWWNTAGEMVYTGKYEAQLMQGDGVTQEEIELAQRISREIPAPFCRIDFLSTAQGLVFGEFTPKPGNYDHFNEETDRQLGEAFLQAEERLFQDILHGKQFEHWRKLL